MSIVDHGAIVRSFSQKRVEKDTVLFGSIVGETMKYRIIDHRHVIGSSSQAEATKDVLFSPSILCEAMHHRIV
jgi:hypothetical protein